VKKRRGIHYPIIVEIVTFTGMPVSAPARGPILGSVVIPCLNAADVIGRTLEALKAQSIASNLEVIVVDNGSSDDSVAIARGMGAHVLLSATRGSAAARNLGVACGRANLVLSLDADCVPFDDLWAQKHVEVLTACPPEVLATAGRTVPFPHPDPWSQRTDVTPQPAWSPSGEPLYAVAGNACYRRATLQSLGGFPPTAADDAALGMVARRRGFRFLWAPEACVLHRNPCGWSGYLQQMTKVGYYAAELAHPPSNRMSPHIRQCRSLLSASRPLLGGELRESLSVVLKTIGQTRGARHAWSEAKALETAGAEWSARFRESGSAEAQA
jgi:hypothetical protein